MIDSFRHNSWATLRLLAFCRDLDPALLETPTAGTYVTIREELAALVSGEEALAGMVEGTGGQHVPPARPTSIDDLVDRAEWLAERWERCLEHGAHPERLVEHDLGGEQRLVRVGSVLTQAIHQANRHRAQVLLALSAVDIEPPVLDGSAYGAWMAERDGRLRGSVDSP